MDKDEFLHTIREYNGLNLGDTIDYNKLYLYSIITHSTAIEGSTMTEVENQILFDDGITAKGKTIVEQNMNLDLKDAYQRSMELAKQHTPVSVGVLKHLSSIVMRRTGHVYNTLNGTFDSSRGDLRLVNVTAGAGGHLYMDWHKVPERLKLLCKSIDERRQKLLSSNDTMEKYFLSFDAHLLLVNIHPWVDGNGRMSRLLMNHLQYEMGIPAAKIKKEDKAEYIEALNASREQHNVTPFRKFMMEEHVENLKMDILNYKLSLGIEEDKSREKRMGMKL